VGNKRRGRNNVVGCDPKKKKKKVAMALPDQPASV
jgi:hypothetical protein